MRSTIHKKAVSIFLALAMAAALLSGCGGSGGTKPVSQEPATTQATATKQVEITFTNWISVEEQTKEVYKKLIEEFEKTHPNIKVKTVGLPFNQVKDQLLIMASGGNPPDVSLVNSQMASAFVAAGHLEPLDDLVPKAFIDDLIEGNRKGATYGGKLMAFPWAPHPSALFWNKTLFAKAGLDPEKPPRTWDEMITMARKIAALKKDAQGNPIYGYGDVTAKPAYTGVTFLRTLYAYGGKFVDDGNNVLLDSPTTTEAFAFLRDMARDGIIPEGLEAKDLRPLFANNQIGLMAEGDFGRDIFRKLSGKGAEFDKNWGVTTIPVNKTGRSESLFTEHQLVIFKGSKLKKEAAELVRWLVDKEAMLIYHKMFGTMSARKSIAALPEMNEDAYAKMFNEQMKTASPLPASHAKYDNAMQELAVAVQMVVVAKDEPAKTTRYAVDKIKALYAGR